MVGGTEETTTGVVRLRSQAREGMLEYPIVAVNEADTKHLFDNRYGTGQSTIDGVTRATNVLWAGKQVVVCGYGWCGRGIAMRVRGLGGHVIVTEVDPVRALEAVMDGYRVAPVLDAAAEGDVFITATGDMKVIDGEALERMKDGAILANSGHFNVEIDIPALEAMSEGKRHVRSSVEEYQLKDGRRLYLLGEGRLINLAAAEGPPVQRHGHELRKPGVVHRVPGRPRGGPRAGRAPCAGGDRPENRGTEASLSWRANRHAHRRAEAVPGELGRGNVSSDGRTLHNCKGEIE